MITQEQSIVGVSLCKYLDAHPGDWTARLILADLYEDIGDIERARMQRWLVENKRHPVCFGETMSDASWINRPWVWWADASSPSSIGYPVKRMIEPKNYRDGGYATRQQAEDTLMPLVVAHDFLPLSEISGRLKILLLKEITDRPDDGGMENP